MGYLTIRKILTFSNSFQLSIKFQLLKNENAEKKKILRALKHSDVVVILLVNVKNANIC